MNIEEHLRNSVNDYMSLDKTCDSYPVLSERLLAEVAKWIQRLFTLYSPEDATRIILTEVYAGIRAEGMDHLRRLLTPLWQYAQTQDPVPENVENLNKPGTQIVRQQFRRASPEDIVEGHIIYIFGDFDVYYKRQIKEVYNPRSSFKGFCATDGCRYGWENCYVEENVEVELDMND